MKKWVSSTPGIRPEGSRSSSSRAENGEREISSRYGAALGRSGWHLGEKDKLGIRRLQLSGMPLLVRCSRQPTSLGLAQN